MTDSISDAPDVLEERSAGRPITGFWVAHSPSDGESRLDDLTPIEREGARYGYQKAGRPFGPGREGLEIWLELRARGKESGKQAVLQNAAANTYPSSDCTRTLHN